MRILYEDSVLEDDVGRCRTSWTCRPPFQEPAGSIDAAVRATRNDTLILTFRIDDVFHRMAPAVLGRTDLHISR